MLRLRRINLGSNVTARDYFYRPLSLQGKCRLSLLLATYVSLRVVGGAEWLPVSILEIRIWFYGQHKQRSRSHGF